MIDTGLPTGTPRVSLELAAREWGTARGVLGRRGGYLHTASFATYAALPWVLRAGTPDQCGRFALVEAAPTTSGRRPVQGWHALGTILHRIGQITVVEVQGENRVRYVAAAPAR